MTPAYKTIQDEFNYLDRAASQYSNIQITSYNEFVKYKTRYNQVNGKYEAK